MNRQSGSILAGAVVLSTIMIVSAASMLLLETNVSRAEAVALNQSRELYYSESAMMMGMRWLMLSDSTAIANAAAGTVTVRMGGFTYQKIVPADFFYTLVVFESFGPASLKRLKAKTTNGTDTVQISWDIQTADSLRSGVTYYTMKNWRDTVLPYGGP